MEQPSNRIASTTPTVIRVQQYDNQSYYGTWHNVTVLQYAVVPGAFVSASMHNSGGTNLFRGALPGNLVGTVEYFAKSTDNHGNVGVSVTKSFVATCPASFSNYCTAGTSSNGCEPVISAVGTPSATSASRFTLSLTGTEGQKQSLFFYGVSGPKASVWFPGSSSYPCNARPCRTPTARSARATGPTRWTGTLTCSRAPGAVGQPLSASTVVDVQVWYRDRAAPGTPSLPEGLEFIVCDQPDDRHAPAAPTFPKEVGTRSCCVSA